MNDESKKIMKNYFILIRKFRMMITFSFFARLCLRKKNAIYLTKNRDQQMIRQ